MSFDLLDNSIIRSVVFYPRTTRPGESSVKEFIDGTIPVADDYEDDIKLGYRLYPNKNLSPVMLFFHGNGEIARDYDNLVGKFYEAGASLMIVDYRGYGWSTGSPTLKSLHTDVVDIQKALPDILKNAGLSDSQLLMMGRSLGSIPAIQMAHRFPEMFKGVIIESGIANAVTWLRSKGLPIPGLSKLPDPFDNLSKMKELQLPLLVIHGEQDTLLPISNGEKLFEASPVENKQFLRIPRAGHNDLLFVGMVTYFQTIQQFIKKTLTAD